MEKEALSRRPKKIDDSLKRTALINQRQQHGERSQKEWMKAYNPKADMEKQA